MKSKTFIQLDPVLSVSLSVTEEDYLDSIEALKESIADLSSEGSTDALVDAWDMLRECQRQYAEFKRGQ